MSACMYVISVKHRILKGTFSHYVVCYESGSFVMLFFTYRIYYIQHLFFSMTRAASPLTKIQCLYLMRIREQLRCLVPQWNLFSISVMTHKVLSLHTTAVVGSEEVFACISCLKIMQYSTKVLRGWHSQPSTNKSDFPHCPSIISRIQCYMFVICRTGRIPPTHISRHQLLGYSFLHCPSLVMLLWIPVIPPLMTPFWSSSECRQDVTVMSEMF